MKRPLVLITVFFSIGIGLGRYLPLSFFWIFILLSLDLALAIFSFQGKVLFAVCVLVWVFLFGALCFKNSQSLPPCHIGRLLSWSESGGPCFLKGFVNSHPAAKNNIWQFRLEAQELQQQDLNRSCCGQVLVSAVCDKYLRYGDELIMRANLYKPHGRYGDYLRKQNIFYIIKPEAGTAIYKTGRNRANSITRLASAGRERLKDLIFSYTSPPAAGILNAMILGEKDYIPRPLYDAMIKTGTVHIMVVSGFNVGVVVFAVLLFLKVLRIPPRPRLLIALNCVMVYCFVTGASNPVVRATVMSAVFIIAVLIRREPDVYNSLSVAALFILVQNPKQIFEIGFQLSFASVTAIAWAYPRLKRILGIGELKYPFFRTPVETALVSFCAWLGTASIIAYNFKVFSPVTVLANLLLVPLAGCLTLTGFTLALTAFLAPPLALNISNFIEFMTFLLVKTNLLLLKLPGAYLFLS